MASLMKVVTDFFHVSSARPSKEVARERLRLIMVNERLNLSPELMEKLRDEIVAVVGKYLEVDHEALNMSVAKVENGMALTANIPVRRVK